MAKNHFQVAEKKHLSIQTTPQKPEKNHLRLWKFGKALGPDEIFSFTSGAPGKIVPTPVQ